MAASPELMRFDDPTTGLDPITAASVDDEVVNCGTSSASRPSSPRIRFATLLHRDTCRDEGTQGARIESADNPMPQGGVHGVARGPHPLQVTQPKCCVTTRIEGVSLQHAAAVVSA
jgi:hypothetical protein